MHDSERTIVITVTTRVGVVKDPEVSKPLGVLGGRETERLADGTVQDLVVTQPVKSLAGV